MFHREGYCPRCAKKINPARSTWLELNHTTGTWHAAGAVPALDSQGCFEFGADCARAILKNGGKLACIGLAA